jgi:hypothetical protein
MPATSHRKGPNVRRAAIARGTGTAAAIAAAATGAIAATGADDAAIEAEEVATATGGRAHRRRYLNRG